MSKALRTSLIVIGVVVMSAALVLIGMNIARFNWGSPWGWHGLVSPEFDTEATNASPYHYGGMMGYYSPDGGEIESFGSIDPSMMSGYGMMTGYSMMGRAGMMDGYGMLGGYGMMGSTGMMGGFTNSSLLGIEPISLSDAEAAIQNYLDIIQDDNLEIGEIMIFDNHAYVRIVEVDTGIGAIEVLVDPVTLAVSPEPGPNMMWNLKYSPMSGFGEFGMMGMMSMMGTFDSRSSESMDDMMDGLTSREISSDLPLSPEGAVEVAQRYLDVYVSGGEADEHTDPFYGYYTIHILKDDDTVGMLSVNGYTRQVLLHTWHGDLLEMSEDR
jgi:hypothetical protein